MVIVSNNDTETADQFVACRSDRAVCQATALLCLADRSGASEFPFCDLCIFLKLIFYPQCFIFELRNKSDLSALTTVCLEIRVSSGYDAVMSYEWFPDFSKEFVPSSLRVKQSGPDAF